MAADGDYHEIAYAVRADGVATPGLVLMEQLENKRWPDLDQTDNHQPSLRRRLLAMFQYLADYGELEQRDSYNRLDNGLWEFKVGHVRLTFYDTDGVGGFVPKYGDPVQEFTGKTKWLLPQDFDEYLRLGFAFPKVSEKTLEEDKLEANAVREEDVDHDRDS